MQVPVERRETDPRELGEKIRERRRELRLSQDQLADRMGTDRNTVYRHEHGLCEMSACTLFQYAEALETTPGALSPARFRPEDGSAPDNSVASLLGRLSGESLEMIRQLAEHLLRQESKMQHI